YFRLRSRSGESSIVACYPESLRSACERFGETTRLLEKAGVPVPSVLARDPDHRFMLLEDVGSCSLYDLAGRTWQELEPYLHQAAELAGRIAGLDVPAVAGLSPPLDRALLERELEQTWREFLAPRSLVSEPQLAGRLERALAALCAQLAAQPPWPCHRDFMARNLALKDGSLVVLDHQDLRLGPPCYDLASLLNDSLFPPEELAFRVLDRAGVKESERPGYHRVAAQRTLKAVGTFARFAERGSPRHLPLIPPTLTRALGHLARLPESQELCAELSQAWATYLLLH
nr:phosphotransferase [Thermoanaerobaculia bacterium]